MSERFLTAEQEKNFRDRCQRTIALAAELKTEWNVIRDQIVELEKQSDNDDLVDYLNNELYSAMYPGWSEYRKIERMMEETGTALWLNDSLSFSEPELVRNTPGFEIAVPDYPTESDIEAANKLNCPDSL